MSRIQWVEPSQRLDPAKPVRHRPHRKMEPGGGGRGHTPRVEVGSQCLYQRLGAAASLTEGVEHRVHEVDQRGLIARQHPVCQNVSRLDDRPPRSMRVAMVRPSRASS